MFGNIVDRLVKKEWTDDDVEKYVGDYQSTYLTYAKNSGTRSVAASGGTTSALLINGLENKDYEGVVVCNTVIVDGKLRPKFTIATSPEEILASRGSKYIETPFLREVLPLIREFQGRVAVVGLPCDLSGLKRRAQKDPEIGNKVALTVALVCGHNSRQALIDETTKRLENEAGKKLADYRFRVGHWRGRLEAEFEDGSVISKPTKYFNDYQNLFFFSERKCMACHDHYGYDADITVGDVWLFRLKNNPIKHTGLITRTGKGQVAYEKASRDEIIASDKLDVKDIMDGQSRIGPSHYNTTARSKASRFFKIKLKDTVGEKVSWHSYLNAYITLANMRLSEKGWGRKLIFKTPRPVLKFYLYFKKGLETLR